MESVIFILSGLVAGVISSLIGMSAGIVLVPTLLILFQAKGVPLYDIAPLTVGTGLACGWLAIVASAFTNRKNIKLDKHLLMILILNSLVGAIVIHGLAPLLVGRLFEVLFALIVLSLPFISSVNKRVKQLQKTTSNNLLLIVCAGFLNGLGNAFGIGGGPFLILLFEKFGYSLKKTLSHMMVAGLFTILLFTLMYVYLGLGKLVLPGCFGFVYWPAVLYVGVPMMVAARYGTMIRHGLSLRHLRIIFNSVMVIVGVIMLLKGA